MANPALPPAVAGAAPGPVRKCVLIVEDNPLNMKLFSAMIAAQGYDVLQATDGVHGLDLGADDYLVKPFALQELEARIRAVVRRGQASEGAKLSYGDLILDTDARRAWLAEKPLKLTAREWHVLEFLVMRSGKIVSKEQIVSAISRWDAEVSYNAIEVHISRLRSKLEPAGLRIHSIRGFGYYLDKQSPS